MVALLPVFGLGNLFNAGMSPNSRKLQSGHRKVFDSSDASSSCLTSSKQALYLSEGYAYLEWGHLSKQIYSGRANVLRCLMFGVQDGPRVNNIYFILVSLK